jgi:hypothetical protein
VHVQVTFPLRSLTRGQYREEGKEMNGGGTHGTLHSVASAASRIQFSGHRPRGALALALAAGEREMSAAGLEGRNAMVAVGPTVAEREAVRGRLDEEGGKWGKRGWGKGTGNNAGERGEMA